MDTLAVFSNMSTNREEFQRSLDTTGFPLLTLARQHLSTVVNGEVGT